MKAIIDCNSFYASCEKVFRPLLQGRPIVVLSNNDGCLIARNDEAKKAGIPMGQPYFLAKELCEEKGVEVFSSNYALYGDLSRRVMRTIGSIYPEIEVYSVDEAFMHIDEDMIPDLNDLARQIRDRVKRWTGIPVSVGIAPTKVLAKIANRCAKKDKAHYRGIYVLRTKSEIEDALRKTPISDIWGIGRSLVPKLQYMGIDTAYKLSQMTEVWAYKNLGGVVGLRLLEELNGRPAKLALDGLEVKKHIASTRSFGNAVTTISELREAIATYTTRAAEKLRRQHSAAGSIRVFAKTDKKDGGWYDYTKGSAYQELPTASSSTGELIEYAMKAVDDIFQQGSRYKKAGVILSGIVPVNSVQQNLYEPHQDDAQSRALSSALDKINRKLGLDTISFAANGVTKNWKMRSEVRSPSYTTSWEDIYVIE
jgi:DNA polymerase V